MRALLAACLLLCTTALLALWWPEPVDAPPPGAHLPPPAPVEREAPLAADAPRAAPELSTPAEELAADWLRGLVRGPDGALSAAFVGLERRGVLVAQALSDAEGTFRFPALEEPGLYTLLAEHPDGYPQRVGVELPASHPIALHLDRGGAIAGTVLAAGVPLPDAELWLLARSPTADELIEPDALVRGDLRDPASGQVRSDAAGNFAMRGVPAGSHVVLARHPAHGLSWVTCTVPVAGTCHLELFLDGAPRLRLRVLRGAEGVAGVTVRGPGGDERTDADGRATLRGLATGENLLALHEADGSRHERRVWLAGDAEQVIALPEGLRHGSLHGADGRPVADCALWLSTPHSLLATRTDARGGFTLRGAPAGPARVELQTADGTRSLLVTLPDDRGAPLAWTLPALGSLSGAVLDEAEAGLPAQVDIARAGLPDAEVFTVFSDGSGAFVFPALEPGRYQLRAEAPGRVPLTAEVDVPGAGLALRPQVGCPLTVELLAADGEPVYDALCGLEDEAGARYSAFSDEEGRVVLRAPAGRYRLHAVHPAFLAPAAAVVELPATRTQRVRFSRGLPLTVRVSTADGPLAGARVARADDPVPEEAYGPRAVLTDGEGLARLTSLPAGRCTLHIRFGDTSFSAPVEVRGGDHIETIYWPPTGN